MKRFLSCVLIAIMLICIAPINGSAVENEIETVWYDDGSYAKIELITNGSRASGSITANKQYTYYDSDDVSQWKAVLTGSFSYTGSSATCTSSSISTTIYDSAWYVASKSSSKSGNTATAYAKMGDRPDGVTVKMIEVNLTLSCDANGNLS